jgi:hypothetical protein
VVLEDSVVEYVAIFGESFVMTQRESGWNVGEKWKMNCLLCVVRKVMIGCVLLILWVEKVIQFKGVALPYDP